MKKPDNYQPESETELKKIGNQFLESIPNCLVLKTDNMALRVGNGRKIKTRNPGMSDHHICLKGYFVAIEAKMPGKDLDADQVKYKAKVIKAGGIFIMYHSIDELEDQMVSYGLIKSQKM